MVDFVRLANTAKRLIDANGRSLTVNQKSTTSSDSNRPWGATTEANADTLTSIGLEFENNKSFITGEVIKAEEKSFLFNAIDSTNKDLTLFDELVDGTENYVISRVNELKPGSVILLYEFIVLR